MDTYAVMEYLCSDGTPMQRLNTYAAMEGSTLNFGIELQGSRK